MKILLSIAGTDAGIKAAEGLKALLISKDTPLGCYEAGYLSYRFTFPSLTGRNPDGSRQCHVHGQWALAKATLDENEAAGRWLRRVEIEEPLNPTIEVVVMQTVC